VRTRLEQLLHAVVTEHGWQSMQLASAPDHVQLCMRSTPSTLPSEIPRLLKGRRAHELRAECPHLKQLPSLWTRSFLLSTAGQVSQELIQRYIARQSKT
jgi:putative transposase